MQALSEISDVRARLEILKRKVLEAEREVKELEEKARSPFPAVDTFEDGTILTWDQTWPSSGSRRFRYVALKAAGKWWLTGNNAYNGITWSYFGCVMRQGTSYNLAKVTNVAAVR